ncbi:MAG: FHA domain-containing protein [Myxococcota bacterium]
MARVRLVQGQSSRPDWDALEAGQRIDIGSDPRSGWCIAAPGVRPFHVELYWDGEVLWVASVEDGADVKVDGMAIDDWCATAAGSGVHFGGAALQVEAHSHALDGLADRTEPRPGGPLGEAKTTVLSPSNAAPMEGARTTVAGPQGSGAPAEVVAAAQRILAAAEAGVIEDAKTKQVNLPPKPAPGGGPVFGGAAAAPGLDPQQTKLVNLPSPSPSPAAQPQRRPPPPRLGRNPRGVARSTPPPPPPSTPSVVIGGGGAAAAVGGPALSAPPASAPAPGVPSPPAPSASGPVPIPQVPPSGAPPAAGAGPSGAFAPPPAASAEQNPSMIHRLQGLLPGGKDGKAKAAAGKDGKNGKNGKNGKKEMSLPPRTWALLGATVVAVAVVLLMDSGEEEAQSQEAPPAQMQGQMVQEETLEDDDEDEEETSAVPVIARPDTLVEPEAPVEYAPSEPEDGETEADPRPKAAADAIMAGRVRDALRTYRSLADDFPDDEAYQAVVRLLSRQIQDRCVDGVDSEGDPCE